MVPVVAMVLEDMEQVMHLDQKLLNMVLGPVQEGCLGSEECLQGDLKG